MMQLRKKVPFRLLALLLCVAMLLTSFSTDGLGQNVKAAKVEEDETALCQDPSDKEHAKGLLEREENEKTAADGTGVEQEPAAQVEHAESLPTAVDNSTKKFFPSIGNQGGIGSCWAWSEVYYIMTYMYNRANNRAVDSSNTFSPKWNYMQALTPEFAGGVSMEQCPIDHFSAVSHLKNYPLDYLANEEDQYRALSYRVQWERLQWGKPSATNPTPITGPNDSDLADIKQLLAEGEILNFETCIGWFNYKKIAANSTAPANKDYVGERIVVACAGTKGTDQGGHAMTIVGYNDKIGVDLNGNGTIEAAEKGAFKVANSWDTDYQNKGYVWVSYDAFNLKSKYCKIGTAATQQRISIATRIRRMKIRTDALKYYVQYTVNTNNCMGNAAQMPDRPQLQIGNCGAGIRPSYMIGDNLSANKIYNYSGTKGFADATFLVDFEIYKNDQYYDWGSDLGNIYQYRPHTYFYFDNENMDGLTVKDVHFVDAEKQITYGASNNYGEGIQHYFVDKNKILPTITNIKFDKEVLKPNKKVKTTVLATDDTQGMQYKFFYQKIDGTDGGTKSRSTSNIFEWTPKEEGKYLLTVKITDSDGNI